MGDNHHLQGGWKWRPRCRRGGGIDFNLFTNKKTVSILKRQRRRLEYGDTVASGSNGKEGDRCDGSFDGKHMPRFRERGRPEPSVRGIHFSWEDVQESDREQ